MVLIRLHCLPVSLLLSFVLKKDSCDGMPKSWTAFSRLPFLMQGRIEVGFLGFQDRGGSRLMERGGQNELRSSGLVQNKF